MSRSSQGHDSYKLCRAPLPDASCQVIIGLLVLEKKILKVFAIYSHGGHVGHETGSIYTNFRSPFLRMLHMKFGFDQRRRRLNIVNNDYNDNDRAWVNYKLTL